MDYKQKYLKYKKKYFNLQNNLIGGKITKDLFPKFYKDKYIYNYTIFHTIIHDYTVGPIVHFINRQKYIIYPKYVYLLSYDNMRNDDKKIYYEFTDDMNNIHKDKYYLFDLYNLHKFTLLNPYDFHIISAQTKFIKDNKDNKDIEFSVEYDNSINIKNIKFTDIEVLFVGSYYDNNEDEDRMINKKYFFIITDKSEIEKWNKII